jgi:hypothetical protein
MPRVHVHVHRHGRARDAGTAHDPKSGQFTAEGNPHPNGGSELIGSRGHASGRKYPNIHQTHTNAAAHYRSNANYVRGFGKSHEERAKRYEAAAKAHEEASEAHRKRRPDAEEKSRAAREFFKKK